VDSLRTAFREPPRGHPEGVAPQRGRSPGRVSLSGRLAREIVNAKNGPFRMWRRHYGMGSGPPRCDPSGAKSQPVGRSASRRDQVVSRKRSSAVVTSHRTSGRMKWIHAQTPTARALSARVSSPCQESNWPRRGDHRRSCSVREDARALNGRGTRCEV
jgi:hypothetical protein